MLPVPRADRRRAAAHRPPGPPAALRGRPDGPGRARRARRGGHHPLGRVGPRRAAPLALPGLQQPGRCGAAASTITPGQGRSRAAPERPGRDVAARALQRGSAAAVLHRVRGRPDRCWQSGGTRLGCCTPARREAGATAWNGPAALPRQCEPGERGAQRVHQVGGRPRRSWEAYSAAAPCNFHGRRPGWGRDHPGGSRTVSRPADPRVT